MHPSTGGFLRARAESGESFQEKQKPVSGSLDFKNLSLAETKSHPFISNRNLETPHGESPQLIPSSLFPHFMFSKVGEMWVKSWACQHVGLLSSLLLHSSGKESVSNARRTWGREKNQF